MLPAPRVRIAPSPTGYFHLGTGRTALFNWLFARQQGGTFILRIEDTDSTRNRAEHVEGIKRALLWLGLDWDEGPYYQSERASLYSSAIEQLLDKGLLYACDCTPEQVRARKPPRSPDGYDGYCRDRGLEPALGRLLRFKTPRQGETYFVDLVRDSKPVQNAAIEDFGVRKSNGDPLFILANVVDDAEMRISHVIRGEDHFTNTTKYILLWEALGYGPLPVFAHLPLINNAQGKKLSKRRDKAALEDYRDDGYLPEAMRNYLALLGWSPGEDREILSLEEMVAEFRLEDVKSAPAKFDEVKLQSVNANYLRGMSLDSFIVRSQEWLLSRWGPVARLVQERARTLAEVYTLTDFLYRSEPVLDEAAWSKATGSPTFAAVLSAAVDAYADIEWTAAAIEQATISAGETAGVPEARKSQAPIRLAVTGRSVGPPLWESLELLGRDRTIGRLRAGLARVGDPPASGS